MKKLIFALAALWLALCGFSPSPVDERKVPVIMYHSVCRTNVGEYVISPESLRSDFGYLKDKGYTAVFMQDVIDFCDGKSDLPQKSVVITFDDGFYNNLFYVADIAREYGMKFIVSVVGSYSDKEKGESKRSPVYSYLNSKEIAELHDTGIVEIANHTYDMHRSYPRKGVRRKHGESEDEYRAALCADSEKCRSLLEYACKNRVNVFTYPFGSYSAATSEILCSLGYDAILTCKGGINVFRKGSRDGLDRVMRYNRPGNSDTYRFMKKIGI